MATKKKGGLASGCFKLFAVVFVAFVGFAILGSSDSKQRGNKAPGVRSEVGSNNNSGQESLRDEVTRHFQSSSEPTAKDALWSANDVFKVGVIDDGTNRDGYARYVSEVLAEKGFKNRRIWIQIIDIVKLNNDGKWVKLGEHRME